VSLARLRGLFPAVPDEICGTRDIVNRALLTGEFSEGREKEG